MLLIALVHPFAFASCQIVAPNRNVTALWLQIRVFGSEGMPHCTALRARIWAQRAFALSSTLELKDVVALLPIV